MPEGSPLDDWLGFRSTDRGAELVMLPEVSRVDGGLFGGVALAAAIRAMERHTERACTWCTVQLVRSPAAPATVGLGVSTLAAGRRQAQVSVIGTDNHGLAFSAIGAASTAQPSGDALVWRTPPRVAPPGDCAERFFLHGAAEPSINTALDVRIAAGRGLDELDGSRGDGSCALWARIRDLDVLDAPAALAVVADHVPFACSQALGTLASGASVDNTIRMVENRPTEWALLDIAFDAVVDGLAHGTVHIWSEDGRLLAVAAQTCRVIHASPMDRT
ncbi:MAG: thioesterase family protein [Acidimicrobiales bacterium]|nr:thioesterase family protein [Acidimicrobiales bacterium]